MQAERSLSTLFLTPSCRDVGYRDPFDSCLTVYPSRYHGPLKTALEALSHSNRSMERLSMDLVFCTLEQCIENRCLSAAKEVHFLLVINGVDSDAFITCHLIRAYASLDSLYDAQRVFLKAPKLTNFSWAAIISAHAKLGHAQQALELYKRMQVVQVELLDGHVLMAVLKACTGLMDLKEGEAVYAQMVALGLQTDAFTGGFLVDMFVKCASMEEATIVFQVQPRRDVVSWNALMAGYASSGHEQMVLQLFSAMQQGEAISGHEDGDSENVVFPDAITYLHVLKACSSLGLLEQGQLVHTEIVEKGLGTDLPIGNTLIDMYGKCGSIRDASAVFITLPTRNVVSWSALISRHTQHGCGAEALELYKQMQVEQVQPDHFTFVCALKACSMQAALSEGRDVHKLVVATGLESNKFIVSTLVDMYCKCESCSDARNLFDRLRECSLVTWNAMISGYVQHEEAEEALCLYEQMHQVGMGADQATYVSVLKACSALAALHKGIGIHSDVVGDGFESDLFISTTLIDLYSQSGNLDDAYRVFSRISNPDVVSCNALIAACAQHNEYRLAANCLEDMQHVGIRPDFATFVCILSVCSHAGLVKEGCGHFKSMSDEYGIVPTLDHFDSMVDLFGHGGCLEEAEDLLETLPIAPSLTEWTSLLSSCRMHADLNVGRRCFDRFVLIDYSNASGYSLMSDVYTHAGMNTEAEEVELLRRYANAWKKPAIASIELDTGVHEFSVGCERHPLSKAIYRKLEELRCQMNEKGYKPHVDSVLNEEEDKEKSLCGHCEKLAIAFGLICTPSGTTLRVSKNLRVCVDCHSASKAISKIEKREIIITDAYRCHHFKDGECSCEDQY
ncbi:hypothetical protein L7F22_020591 [Adiantum nelumboides]|nr:hypothetical protein [Adiantum nelumboides]